MPKIVLLWTDVVVWLLVAAICVYVNYARNNPALANNWRKVGRSASAMSALVVLSIFVVIALLDSIHFRAVLPAAPGIQNQSIAYATRTDSVLDVLLDKQLDAREKTYSAPLAYESHVKEAVTRDGVKVRENPRLLFGGAHLENPRQEWVPDLMQRAVFGLVGGAAVALVLSLLICGAIARTRHINIDQAWRMVWAQETDIPWRAVINTIWGCALVLGVLIAWMQVYHVFGTDKTGNDVLVQAIKSIRTAFVIGSLTTLAIVPVALFFGIAAGYFKGWVDDVIQYIYTVLSSVPNILLIAACVLMIQVFIDKNPQLFETGLERADVKLFLLCLVLGLTSWADLCRLIRGETLKLRELDFVQAAHAFGAKASTIMLKHIVPNVVHIVLIKVVLEFSTLVLYEAVLSYVGVGVDPNMNSFGGMINLARSEMSRDPIIWWAFAAAFVFMVSMVLAANLVADAVQEAFDPRAKKLRASLRQKFSLGGAKAKAA